MKKDDDIEIIISDVKEKPKVFDIGNLPFSKIPKDAHLVGKKAKDGLEIFIENEVVKFIDEFATTDTSRELGGILIGNAYRYREKPFILISGAIEAKYSESSKTTMKFTHKSWEYIYSVKDAKYPNKKIIGWFHTHPTFGIFLSDYDKFIHKNFFSEPYQVAYVVDPINKQNGFFQWEDSEIIKCSGYSIIGYTPEKKKKVYPGTIDIFRSAAIIFLVVLSFLLLSRINDLEITILKNKKESISQIARLEEKIKEIGKNINSLKLQNKKIEDDKEKLKNEIELLVKLNNDLDKMLKKLQKETKEIKSTMEQLDKKIEKESKLE